MTPAVAWLERDPGAVSRMFTNRAAAVPAVVLELPVARFDAWWRSDHTHAYVSAMPPDGHRTDDTKYERLNAVMDKIIEEKLVHMPVLWYPSLPVHLPRSATRILPEGSDEGGSDTRDDAVPRFADGRHTFAACAQLNVPAVEVIVPAVQAPRFVAAFGAKVLRPHRGLQPGPQ